MNTCDTCKWWGVESFTANGIQFGICNCKMVCQPNYGEGYAKRTPSMDGVITADEGGATGDLMTAPKFGCVHYECLEKIPEICIGFRKFSYTIEDLKRLRECLEINGWKISRGLSAFGCADIPWIEFAEKIIENHSFPEDHFSKLELEQRR